MTSSTRRKSFIADGLHRVGRRGLERGIDGAAEADEEGPDDDVDERAVVDEDGHAVEVVDLSREQLQARPREVRLADEDARRDRKRREDAEHGGAHEDRRAEAEEDPARTAAVPV